MIPETSGMILFYRVSHCYVQCASRSNNVEALTSRSNDGERRRKKWVHNFKGSTMHFKNNIFEQLRTRKGEVLVHCIQSHFFFFCSIPTNQWREIENIWVFIQCLITFE